MSHNVLLEQHFQNLFNLEVDVWKVLNELKECKKVEEVDPKTQIVKDKLAQLKTDIKVSNKLAISLSIIQLNLLLRN